MIVLTVYKDQFMVLYIVERFHGTTVFILYINQATETAVVMSPS